MTYRLGILVSHPIQYYAPWFRYLAKRMDIEVFYAHRQDAKGQADAGFGVEFEWDIPLLDGYRYRWLKNVAKNPSIRTYAGLDTPELYDIIRPGSFDAFLLFGWNRKCSWQAIRACRKAKIPVLMRGDSHLGTKRSPVTSLLKYLPYRSFLPRIDAHLYVGQRNKAYLLHYGVPEDRLFFSPHFVDTEFFARGAEEAKRNGKAAALRDELGISPETFVFLFVGKMIGVKRPHDFLAATLKILSAANPPDIHAVFVGDGPLRQRLEDAAASRRERIHFVGFRNQGELPKFYQMGNAVVLPSAAETWGLVVNEALACGLPSVVSDTIGCAADLILEGETGFTFPVGNVERLAGRMLDLMRAVEHSAALMVGPLVEKSEQFSMAKATEGLEAAAARETQRFHSTRMVASKA